MKLMGKCLIPGIAEGEALVTSVPISFFGEIDASSGKITSPHHEHFGKSITGKIFVVPTGKGSSGGPNVIYSMKLHGTLPAGMIVEKNEPTLAAGILTGNIPAVTNLDQDPTMVIKTGDYVKIDANKGTVVVVSRSFKKEQK